MYTQQRLILGKFFIINIIIIIIIFLEYMLITLFFIHIEKMIAIKTDRYPIFIKVWGKWLNLLEV